jgi:hypothetical protein
MRRASDSVEAWVVLNLAPAIKSRLQDAGVYSTEIDRDGDGWEWGTRSNIVIVTEGKIFHLSQSCLPLTVHEDYFSVGSGEEVASGALRAMKERCTNLSAEAMLATALSAAADHSHGVSGPFVYLRCSDDDAEGSTHDLKS